MIFFFLMIWLGILIRLNFYQHVYNTSNFASLWLLVVVFNKRSSCLSISIFLLLMSIWTPTGKLTQRFT